MKRALAGCAAAGLALLLTGAELEVRGIDVSHHQGEIDWARVAGAGIRFAYLKATEGRDFKDPRFASHWRAAAKAGIARGAYHFFTFCSPGREQAEHFLRVVPPAEGALTPVADVEFVGNCKTGRSLDVVRRELASFLATVERAWGTAPILYVTPDSYERVLGGGFAAHPIWIRSVESEPARDAYGGWRIWQYSETGRVPGIAGPVDLDVLRPGVALESLVRVPAPGS